MDDPVNHLGVEDSRVSEHEDYEYSEDDSGCDSKAKGKSCVDPEVIRKF